MAERKKFKQKKSPFRERTPDLETLLPFSPEERARVDDLISRLSTINGVEGLFFGRSRLDGNRKLYIVTRGGDRGEDPMAPSAAIEEQVTDEFDEVFSDRRSRWGIEMQVVTSIGLQRSRRDFDKHRGQIITSVWHRG